MTRTELLMYAAGYFDGEGCVTLMKMSKYQPQYLRIAIVTGDVPSLQIFVDLFGGRITPAPHNSTIKKLYRWDRNGSAAQTVLSELIPYLRSDKKAKAESVMLLKYGKRGRPREM